jgi:DNA (cytosine-5)-methyltransferase 1
MQTALTFFSGAGGMCAGLAQVGFEIIGGNEWDAPIADIWDANHSVKCDRRSILDIPVAELPYADLYHFSSPCQAYSQANSKRPPVEDTAIAEKIAAIITHGLLPRWVTIENVPLYRNSQSWDIIATALSVAGYSVEWEVLNAYDFGSPQSRKRFIARASLCGLGPLIPSEEKIGWDIALAPTVNSLRQTNFSRGQGREFLKTNPKAGLYLAQRTGYSVKNGPQLIPRGQPSWTITAAMAHDGKKNKEGFPSFRSPATIIDWQNSRISWKAWEVRSLGLAALQGFPGNWLWPGAESTAAKAIGNAVPIQLARAIGLSFMRGFDDEQI